MNKETVYNNIYNFINNGYFIDKYTELTQNLNLYLDNGEINENIKTELESISAKLFNAILIGCQLFDDEDRIKEFADCSCLFLDSIYLERLLSEFNISKEEALTRLNHGFAVHFTTPAIASEIQNYGSLVGAGKNALFTEEEDKIIRFAEEEQKKNDPTSAERLNYLYRGWGTGVSSYGSVTNGFWMYHTPESLSFMFGDISERNKETSMKCVLDKISALKPEDKKIVFETMSGIYDRLIGDEQNVCCILIDRDAFEYEVDYFYDNGKSVGIERRPFNNSFSSIDTDDSKIKNDIDVKNLRFIEIPTVFELERIKSENLENSNSMQSL